MQRATPSVSIIVPVRNGQETLANCLTALLRTEYPADRREIVIVENGSADASFDIAQQFPVRVVRAERVGLSHARNRGIAESRGDILVFLDCDCFVTVGWLRAITAGFAEGDVYAVTGEVVAHPPRTLAELYTANRKPYWQEFVQQSRPFAWLLVGNAAFRRATFERVGLFDPRFTGVGCEDIDFAWRFLLAGLTARREPRALAFHHHRVTVRGIFRQNYGYGRGQVVLRSKYPNELPWDWRRELAAWRDLIGTGLRAARAAARTSPNGRRLDRYYPTLDLVRKSAQRLGFLRGALGARLRSLRAPAAREGTVAG